MIETIFEMKEAAKFEEGFKLVFFHKLSLTTDDCPSVVLFFVMKFFEVKAFFRMKIFFRVKGM